MVLAGWMLKAFGQALREIVIGEEGAVIEERLAPIGHIVGAEEFVILSERVTFGVAEAAQDTQFDIVWFEAIDGKHAGTHAYLPGNWDWKTGDGGFLYVARSVAFHQDEVQALVVVGEHEQRVQDAEVTEGLCEGTGNGDGDGFELDKVDFEQATILTGQAFDVGDGGFQELAAKAHGSGVLKQAGISVIAKLREKGGEGVPVREILNVLAREFIVFCKHAPTSTFQCIQ